jgi:hypothetical protein
MPLAKYPTRQSDLTDPDLWEADRDAIARAMIAIKNRFIKERTEGFTHRLSGQTFAPVSREEAEARWEKAAPKFEEVAKQFDPEVAPRLGTHKFNAPRARSKHAEMDEPSLRRGESMVSYICGKRIQA